MSSTTERIVLPAQRVRSLCWDGNTLVNWAGGAARYNLDGSHTPSRVNYAYRFNAATASPSGRFVALYERLGTKAVLLRDGRIVRELNRSFYHAHVYEYPIVLFALPDGREVLAHCPDKYNRLEIEDAETGERLTQRQTPSPDFFHSRLAVNAPATRLLSAGWAWHPFNSVGFYDVARALADSKHLDGLDGHDRERAFPEGSVEVNSAAFVGSDRVVVATARDADDFEDDDPGPRARPVPSPSTILPSADTCRSRRSKKRPARSCRCRAASTPSASMTIRN